MEEEQRFVHTDGRFRGPIRMTTCKESDMQDRSDSPNACFVASTYSPHTWIAVRAVKSGTKIFERF